MRADSISFAPTFWQSRSSFISSLLLFSCDPLALGSHLRCVGLQRIIRAARQGNAGGLHIVRSDFLAKPGLDSISSLLLFSCDPLALGSHLGCVGLQPDHPEQRGRAMRADSIMFAPTFWQSRSSFISSLLLFSCDPLALGSHLEMRRPAADHPERRGRAMRADCISFAPTFWQSRSSFISSLLLFSCDPLALGSHLRCAGLCEARGERCVRTAYRSLRPLP